MAARRPRQWFTQTRVRLARRPSTWQAWLITIFGAALLAMIILAAVLVVIVSLIDRAIAP